MINSTTVKKTKGKYLIDMSKWLSLKSLTMHTLDELEDEDPPRGI